MLVFLMVDAVGGALSEHQLSKGYHNWNSR